MLGCKKMHDTDRRVIYTKSILRASLMTLLEEKPISRISVTELCNAAGVNRGTFYSHYRQPEDVMHQMEDELIGEIEKVLDGESEMSVIHRRVLMILDDKRDACRVLFGPNGDPECVRRVLDVSFRYFRETWQDALKVSDEMVEYLHSFIFAGTVQLLREWITDDRGRTPGEMAEILFMLQRNTLSQMRI